MAPLTGIAFTINWLIGKLNLKIGVVKTTRMTTNSCGLHQSGLNESLHGVIVAMVVATRVTCSVACL